MNYLHPCVRWVFRLKNFGFFLFLSIFFSIILKSIYYFFPIFLLFLVLNEIYARMTYNRWRYEFTKDNLKIERGIIWKHYTNIPYERVQNVNITRGILARIFGFSTLEIETAGQSGYPDSGFRAYSNIGFKRRRREYHSEGYIPAVSIEEAEKIREFLIKKISRNSEGL